MAQPSMEAVVATLEDHATKLAHAVANRDWPLASAECRECMRALGGLSLKLDTIVELHQEGFWTAEVDRALERAAR